MSASKHSISITIVHFSASGLYYIRVIQCAPNEKNVYVHEMYVKFAYSMSQSKKNHVWPHVKKKLGGSRLVTWQEIS